VTTEAQFNDLLGLIYDGPMEARPWESFLGKLRQDTGSRIATLTLNHPRNGAMDTYVLAMEAGDPTNWVETEATYREKFMRSDPQRTDSVKPGQLIIIEAAKCSADYRRFLEAVGVAYAIRMGFTEPSGMLCWLDAVRGDIRRPYSKTDIALFQDLRPHLERALKLYAALMRRETERSLYEETIDHFVLGSILLNGESEIIHCNQAALNILKLHPEISVERHKLTIADKRANLCLRNAINTAIEARAGTSHALHGELVRLRSEQCQLIGLLVCPVPVTPYYQGTNAPHAIIYLSDLAQDLTALQPSSQSSQHLVMQLFDLTKQEATLALLLADGKTLSAAAMEMGIVEITARNYSKKIYEKMGINRQTDLVRLIYRSFALLR